MCNTCTSAGTGSPDSLLRHHHAELTITTVTSQINSTHSDVTRCTTHLDGSVVRIEQELRERGDLRRAVPAVRAVHEHRLGALLERLSHQPAGAQQVAQVVQPFARVQRFEPSVRV